MAIVCPTGHSACCPPPLNDICPLAGQPTWQHLWAGEPVVSVVVGTKGWQKGTIHAAPWQIVQHSMGSWHRPLLPGSSWREHVEGTVFSHQFLSFLNYGWRNSAKNLHFVSVPALKPSKLFPVVSQMGSRLPAVPNLHNGQSDTLVVGELFIWSLTHGYKTYCYIVLLL